MLFRSLIDACRVYLDEEIATVKPKVILALGATAASAFNIKNISMVEGTEPASGVLVAFHPAYVLRSPSKEVRLAMAIALAAKKAGMKVKPKTMEQLPLFKYEVRT